MATLWSERAADWADVMEGWNGWGVPAYRHVLERVEVGPGTDVLDVGCGAGRFARIAADRGARCAGLDATEAFVEIARTRVIEGDFRVGDMEKLPWADDSFDVVTGFNSFFIAADIVGALREVGRVGRPGASLAMTVFGRPEKCQSTDVFASIGRLMPGREEAAPAKERAPLHAEGELEAVVVEAGLEVRDAGYFELTEVYPDRATMTRGYMAAPPFVRAAQVAGEDAVREALSEALAGLEDGDGRYRLTDELRFLIATV